MEKRISAASCHDVIQQYCFHVCEKWKNLNLVCNVNACIWLFRIFIYRLHYVLLKIMYIKKLLVHSTQIHRLRILYFHMFKCMSRITNKHWLRGYSKWIRIWTRVEEKKIMKRLYIQSRFYDRYVYDEKNVDSCKSSSSTFVTMRCVIAVF